MKLIVMQGLNHNVGTSSVAAAITYSIAKLGKTTVCIDANTDAMGNSISNLFGLEECKSGWLNAMENGSSLINDFNEAPVFYQYEEKAFFVSLGKLDEKVDSLRANSLISPLLDQLSKYEQIDYLIVDAGIKGNTLAKAFCSHADMVLTVLFPDGNCLLRLNSSNVEENEYLVVNALIKKSTIMNDVNLLLQSSAYKSSFLRHSISFDESVMNAYMRQMPVSRFLQISVATLDIEKILIDIMLICQDCENSLKKEKQ